MELLTQFQAGAVPAALMLHARPDTMAAMAALMAAAAVAHTPMWRDLALLVRFELFGQAQADLSHLQTQVTCK